MSKSNRIARVFVCLLSLVISFYHGGYSVQVTVKQIQQDDFSPTPPSLTLPPLAELVQSKSAMNTACPIGTAPILDTILHEDSDDRRIPRVLHFTSKSRCATIEVMNNINTWRSQLPHHSIYWHDDEAVDRLNNHPLSQALFPLLNETLKCVTGGATKSDLWRYLGLGKKYLYGGIYSDIDNTPTHKINEHTIQTDDDFFSILEALGIIAQYFLASSPRHPLMKESLNAGIQKLRFTHNVMNNNPADTTGPGAIKRGFIHFMNNTSNGYIPAGIYSGLDGRNITVVGNKDNSREYVNRGGMSLRFKREYYDFIGTKHFFDSYDLPRTGRISCMQHLRMSNGTNRIANYTHDGAKYVES